MMVNRFRGNVEPPGDVGVPQSFVEQLQNFHFARGEPRRMRARRRPRSADALDAELLAERVDETTVAELLEDLDGALQRLDIAGVAEQERLLIRIAARLGGRR